MTTQYLPTSVQPARKGIHASTKLLLSLLTALGSILILAPSLVALADLATVQSMEWLGVLPTVTIFSLILGLVYLAPSTQIAIKRAVLSLGASLALTPTSISMLFVVQLKSWSTLVSGGTDANSVQAIASIVGTIVLSNMILLGLGAAVVTMMTSHLVGRRHSKAPLVIASANSASASA